MFWAKLFRFKQEPTEHYLIFVLLPFRFFFFSFSAENQSSHQLASWWRIVPFLLVNQKFVQLPTCIDLSTCNKQKTKQKQTWREHRPDRFQFKKFGFSFSIVYYLKTKQKTCMDLAIQKQIIQCYYPKNINLLVLPQQINIVIQIVVIVKY